MLNIKDVNRIKILIYGWLSNYGMISYMGILDGGQITNNVEYIKEIMNTTMNGRHV